MSIQVLVIEDDLIIAENLKENLTELGYVVTGIASDFSKAIALYASDKPDVCIVDIYLKGSAKNGIETMQHLNAGAEMPIIYLTSFSDHEIREKAKSTNPSAFLVKPASKAQIDVAIDFALTNFRKKQLEIEADAPGPCPYVTRKGYFFIRIKDRYEKIYAHDISFVMAAGSYTKIYTSDREYTISAGMKSFLQQLKSEEIIRCHRSYAVNIHKVKAFDDIGLFVIQGKEYFIGMKFKFFSIICGLFFFCSDLYCQKVEERVLKTLVNKIDSLTDKNIEATYIAIDALDSILSIYPNPKYQYISYMQRAVALKWEDKLDLSEGYFQKSIKIVDELKDTSGIIKVYGNYVQVLDELGKDKEVLDYFDMLFKLVNDEEKYQEKKAYMHYFLANFNRGKNDSISISNYIESFEIAKRKNNSKLEGAVQYSLAMIYKRQKKYKQTIESLALAEEGYGANTVYSFAVYSTWAKVLGAQGKVDEATKKFKLVLDNPNASKRNLIYSNNGLGLMLKDNDRLNEAEKYLLKGIELAKGDDRYIINYAQLLANIGGVYYDQKRYRKALPYYEEAKEIFLKEPKTSIENKRLILAAYLETSLKLKGSGELDVAFQDFQILNDSLMVIQQQSIDEEMIEKYRVELKEAENQQLIAQQQLKEKQINNQQKILIGGGIALGFISLLSFLFYRQREKQKQLNQVLSTQRDQIKILNRELNHRVKNNLAFMTSLLEMQGRRTDSDEAKQVLRESESRLKALSIVHNNLFQNENNTAINLKNYLLEIVNHLQNIFEVLIKTDWSHRQGNL